MQLHNYWISSFVFFVIRQDHSREKLERWSLEKHAVKLGFKERPVNIYEVHAGSWKRNEDHSSYTFKQLKGRIDSIFGGDELHPRRIYASDGPIHWD